MDYGNVIIAKGAVLNAETLRPQTSPPRFRKKARGLKGPLAVSLRFAVRLTLG